MAGLLTHLCPARSALFGDGPICHGKLNVMQLRAPLEFAYGFPHGGSNFRLCRVAHLATSRLFSPACLVAVALFVTAFTYSTVTLLAKFLGLSTSVPFISAA